jgi:mono/diheme cytochrome c family protein
VVALRFALLALLALLGGCDRSGGLLRADDAQVVAQGKAIYMARCAACHGAKLEGQPNWRERDASGRLPAPPHDPSGHTWHHPDQVLFDITKYGVAQAAKIPDYQTAMPKYEGVLSDAEIVAVLSFIKAQWPAEIRAKQDEVTARTRRLGSRNDPSAARASWGACGSPAYTGACVSPTIRKDTGW